MVQLEVPLHIGRLSYDVAFQAPPTSPPTPHLFHQSSIVFSQLMSEQDESLDVLGQSAARLGQISLNINEELISQNKMIDEMGNEVSSSSSLLIDSFFTHPPL